MDAHSNSFITWMYRPYLDLGQFHAGPLHVRGVKLAYDNLINEPAEVNQPQTQTVLFPTFRDMLVQEVALPQYKVENPLQLASDLRTESWQQLCDYLENFSVLHPLTQFRVAQLLSKLCFYQCVLDYVPMITPEKIAQDETFALLAYTRAQASSLLRVNSTSPHNKSEFEIIASIAPPSTVVRIDATYQMAMLSVQNAKDDLDTLAHWVETFHQEIQAAKSDFPEDWYQQLMSRYHCTAAFLPYILGDKQGAFEEMALAEFYAELMPRTTKLQHIIANEILRAAYESTTKTALWAGDLDIAEERINRVIQIDPFDSRSYLELGKILVARQQIPAAIKAYTTATSLGPPATKVAQFMLGQCYETLGELESACHSYLSTLKMDNNHIKAAERLTIVANHLGNKAIETWINLHLTKLQQQKEIT